LLKQEVIETIWSNHPIRKKLKMKNIKEINIPKGKSWFETWFDTVFYHQLYANRDENEAANFIDELLAELQPQPGLSMLDLGCGNGRHSKHLAMKGFNVTGIDLSSSSIRSARKWENGSLRFYRQDMRMPFGRNKFEYVFNLFTSFGYFNDAADDSRVVANISEALKTDGLLVMDYINSSYAEKNLKAAETKDIDGILYQIQRSSNEKYFFKTIFIEDIHPDKPFEFTEQIRKYSLDDFYHLFRKHGLSIEQVFGDYDLNEFDPSSSPRLIVIAKKNDHEKEFN
jgi:SAM-dependent methyltransferase